MSSFKCCKSPCEGTKYLIVEQGNQIALFCTRCRKFQKWLTKAEVKMLQEGTNKMRMRKTNYNKILSMSIREMAEDRVKINAPAFGGITWVGDFGFANTREEAIEKEIEWLETEI